MITGFRRIRFSSLFLQRLECSKNVLEVQQLAITRSTDFVQNYHYTQNLNPQPQQLLLGRLFTKTSKSEKPVTPRLNEQITAQQVRVKFDDDTSKVVNIADALMMARDKDGDLIETVPFANPPVCIIMEYNKFRFEQRKKEKELKKNLAERTLKDKELNFTVNISDHDFTVKQKKLKEMLDDNCRVKIVIKTGKNVKIDPLLQLFGRICELHQDDCTFCYLPKSYLNQPVEFQIVKTEALNASKQNMKRWSRSEMEEYLWKLEKRRQMEQQGFLSTGNPETSQSEEVK